MTDPPQVRPLPVITPVMSAGSPNFSAGPGYTLRGSESYAGSEDKTVTSIQRLSTHGGKAPNGGCDSSHKGEQTRSHYTAVYYFYTRQ